MGLSMRMSDESVPPHLHLIAGGGAQKGDVEVEVGRLLDAALVDGASWCDPHNHLEQVCRAQAILSGFPPSAACFRLQQACHWLQHTMTWPKTRFCKYIEH